VSRALSPGFRRVSKTKIVATVGPACAAAEMLEALLLEGVDVFRLNMAHGTAAEHAQRLALIREISGRLGQPVAVLADLGGPKIRLGEIPGAEVVLNADQCVRFVRGTGTAAATDLTATYDRLVDELAVGDRIMLADGTVSLVVEDRGEDFALCRVVQPGKIRSRQGVNLPGVKLSVSALTPVDRENAAWAARNGVDFLGLSFVRRAEDVRQLKQVLTEQGSQVQVIAKIEKPEALQQLTAIVAAADGVMVARGDLGVEIDIAQVALAQKQIVAECRRQRKPVVIATQMLDSMQHNRVPTRAEVTDVANAILDGADACMLSGETAIGEYPREAVEMMHRIALATEQYGVPRAGAPGAAADAAASEANPITEAVVAAAGEIAERLAARLVLVASRSGTTALALSKQRCNVHTVGVSDSDATLRRMCLYWGVLPLAGAPTTSQQEVLGYAIARGKKGGYLTPGDRIVLVGGTGLAASAHNQLVVQEVPE